MEWTTSVPRHGINNVLCPNLESQRRSSAGIRARPTGGSRGCRCLRRAGRLPTPPIPPSCPRHRRQPGRCRGRRPGSIRLGLAQPSPAARAREVRRLVRAHPRQHRALAHPAAWHRHPDLDRPPAGRLARRRTRASRSSRSGARSGRLERRPRPRDRPAERRPADDPRPAPPRGAAGRPDRRRPRNPRRHRQVAVARRAPGTRARAGGPAMTDDTFSDAQIRAAFIARSEGSPSPDLADRIGAATRRTRQLPKLVVLPGGIGIQPERLLWAAAISATSLALVGGLLFAGRQPDEQTSVVPPPSPSQPFASPSTPSADPSTSPLPSPSDAPSPPAEPTTSPPASPAVDPGFRPDTAVLTLTGDLR